MDWALHTLMTLRCDMLRSHCVRHRSVTKIAMQTCLNPFFARGSTALVLRSSWQSKAFFERSLADDISGKGPHFHCSCRSLSFYSEMTCRNRDTKRTPKQASPRCISQHTSPENLKIATRCLLVSKRAEHT